MKLKTLNTKPADFALDLIVQELDGSEKKIPFICIGRTTLDWQPLLLARLEKEANAVMEQEEKVDAEKAKAKAVIEDAAKDEAKPKKRERVKIPHAEIAKNTEKAMQAAVAMVREVASGWELDNEFTDENIQAAIVCYPGMQQKLWNEYDARIKGNRAKN